MVQKNIQAMSLEELEDLSNLIANYLSQETPYDVETVMQNMNVLEITIVLHHLFDMSKHKIIFDKKEQSLVHQLLMNKHLNFSGPSEVGWGLGEALANSLINKDSKTFVIMNDHALNVGSTYESLVEISKEYPNLIIIMIDEQESLLRHYGSIDAWIKSIRISKTYTSIKQDMKQVLNNRISQPLLSSLTWIRDQVKETIIEPSIFTQFNIEYHGPINGQNIKECIKVLTLTDKFVGPFVIHVQTRLRNKGKRKLDFPNYKLDRSTPTKYQTYLEHLDQYFLNKDALDDLVILSDGVSISEHLIHFSQYKPKQYYSVNASSSAMVDMGYGFAETGKQVVLLVSSLRLNQVIDKIKHHFDNDDFNVLLVVYEAGLARFDRLLHAGVNDMSSYLQLNNTSVMMPSSISRMKWMLNDHFSNSGFRILRLPHLLVEDEGMGLDTGSNWREVIPINEDSTGVIITFGPVVENFKKKLLINNLNIGLIDAETINDIDLQYLEKVRDLKLKLVIYNIEGTFDLLSHTIYKTIVNQKLDIDIDVLSLENVNLEGSSKKIKDNNNLHIEDAINRIERS